MTVTAFDLVQKFAPGARQNYVDAFTSGAPLLATAGITTPLRLAHFMAQCLHETGGLRILEENMNYTAKRIAEVWPSRPEAVKFAGDPEGLANSVYANRMGNGPASSGDGWKYRGRGILQTTGREAYRKYGKRCGVDFEAHPELVVDGQHALKPALAEWTDGDLNAAADANDIKVITKRINGGWIGLEDRKAWFARIFAFIDKNTNIEDSIEWRVQEALNKAAEADGNPLFECGEPDGVVGPHTRAAILAYAKAKGLQATNPIAITDALISALGLTP